MVAAEAKVVIVSVNYRLAPEYPLPIAYEDSWVALKWVISHANGDGHEPWLKDHADFNRVYLGGDSAGGNIAHHIAIRVGLEKLEGGVKLDGIFLACPYFWGKDPIDGEGENLFDNDFVEDLWLSANPNSSGLDDPSVNPKKDRVDDEGGENLGAKDFFEKLWLFVNPNSSGLDDPLINPEKDPETGLQIKDVEIDSQINLSARLYLPKNVDPVQKIPLFVYFHGGGFVIESAFSPSYNKHLSMVAAEAKVVIVSVNYRLAPEYPLPIAYEDSWVALKWVISHANGDGHEPWLKDHADFNRVYLGGDSAGGNIAHHMAIRVGLEKLECGVKLDGIFLACPYFWGKDPIDGEGENLLDNDFVEDLWLSANPNSSGLDDPKKDPIDGEGGENLGAKDFFEKLWLFVNPNSSGLDDPLINPEKDPNLCSLGCEKVLVYVAGKDALRFRGFYYKEALEKSGWPGTVEVVEVKDEPHVFHLFAPEAENAMAMLKKLARFLNQS